MSNLILQNVPRSLCAVVGSQDNCWVSWSHRLEQEQKQEVDSQHHLQMYYGWQESSELVLPEKI